MPAADLANELEAAGRELSESGVAAELSALLPASSLPGLHLAIRASVIEVADRVKRFI